MREAVMIRRAHMAALVLSPEERELHPETWRLPELNLRDWYERADAAVRALDGE